MNELLYNEVHTVGIRNRLVPLRWQYSGEELVVSVESRKGEPAEAEALAHIQEWIAALTALSVRHEVLCRKDEKGNWTIPDCVRMPLTLGNLRLAIRLLPAPIAEHIRAELA